MPEQAPFNLEQTVDQLRDSGLSPEETYGELVDVPEFQMEAQKRGFKSSRQARDLIETRFAEQKATKQAEEKEQKSAFKDFRKMLGKFQKEGMGRVKSNTTGLFDTLGNLSGAAGAEGARSDERVNWINDDLKKGKYGQAALNGLKSVPLLGGALEDTMGNIGRGEYGKVAGDVLTGLLPSKGLARMGLKSSVQSTMGFRGLGDSLATNPFVARAIAGAKAGAFRTPGIGRMAKDATDAVTEEKALQLQRMRNNASPENPIPPMDQEEMMQAQQQGKPANPMPSSPARTAQPPSAGMGAMSPVEQQLWEALQKETPQQAPFPKLPVDQGLNRLATQEGLNRPLGPRPTGMAQATPEQMSMFEQMQQQAQPSPFPRLPGGRGMFDVGVQEQLAKQKPPLFSGFGEPTPAQKGQWTKIQNRIARESAKVAEEAADEAKKKKKK